MTAKKVQNLFFLENFVFHLFFGFILSVYVLYLLENGCTMLQAGIINALYMITTCVFEIPTGVFADTFGNKKSVLICFFMTFIGCIGYGISTSMFGFIVAEMLLAFGFTFYSGAFETLIIYNLKQTKEFFLAKDNDSSFVKFKQEMFSQAELIKSFAIILGGFGGAFIGVYNLRITWFIAALSGVFGFIVVFKCFKETGTTIRFNCNNVPDLIKQILNEMKKNFSLGFRTLKNSKVVFWLTIIGMVWFFGLSGFNMQWQPNFADSGGKEMIKNVWVVFISFVAFGNLITRWLAKFEHKERYFIFLGLFGAGICGLISSWQGFFLYKLMFFSSHEIFRGIYNPLETSYANSHINDQVRSTVRSFMRSFYTLGSFAGLILTGWIADNFSIDVSWMVCGGALVLGGFLVCRLPNEVVK